MSTRTFSTRLVRALAPAKRAAGLAVALSLLSTACNDSVSPIDSARLRASSSRMPAPTAPGFSILANAAVTCTDGTITGDVGTFLATPTGSIVLTRCPVTGTTHVGDVAAVQAFNSFLSVYAALAPKAGDVCTTLTGTLAGVTLSPGAYCFVAAATLTGVLTLDGPTNGVWTFRIGTGGTGALTGTNFSVVTANGAQPCNVNWWVAQAATMTTSAFQGNILAGAAITMTGGSFSGNAWSKADVTNTGTAFVGCGGSAATTPPPSCQVSSDRVTGGGWISGRSSGKATFGVTGGIKHSKFWGHLEYDDHGQKGKSDDIRVKGTGVTAYVLIDAVTRRIEGTAEINGKRGFTYRVDVADNGKNRNDTFSLTLSNGYSASGKLLGGSIQLHKSHGDACKGRHGDDDGNDDEDDDHED
jgi:Ice-binding-like